MGLIDLFSTVRYEKALSKIKREHFNRVADLEDNVHKEKLNNQTLELKLNMDIKDLEHKYKLDVQEIVSKNDKELLTVKHAMELEREKFEVEKEKLQLKHQQELDKRTLQVEKDVFEKMKDAIEREAQAQGVVVEVQGKIMDRLVMALPNVNKFIQEGSPTLKVEANINKGE